MKFDEKNSIANIDISLYNTDKYSTNRLCTNWMRRDDMKTTEKNRQCDINANR